MSELLDELVARARELPAEERAQLAQELLQSVERETDPEVEVAWDAEIARRLDTYERGEAKLIPAEDVFEEARRLTR